MITEALERAKTLSAKPGLSPVEYAFTIVMALHVGVERLRNEQREQQEIDPGWTAVEISAKNIECFANYTQELVEVLSTALEYAESK
jgi:hypothetical protein